MFLIQQWPLFLMQTKEAIFSDSFLLFNNLK